MFFDGSGIISLYYGASVFFFLRFHDYSLELVTTTHLWKQEQSKANVVVVATDMISGHIS